MPMCRLRVKSRYGHIKVITYQEQLITVKIRQSIDWRIDRIEDRRTAQDSNRFAQYFRGVFRLSTFYVGGQKVNLWSQLRQQQPNNELLRTARVFPLRNSGSDP
ncbi:hypothetical protein ACLKA7_011240 [Drosophila subpalustris]